eukprot:CAMPEP_0206397508 /NCGR_PEP_ID=MMETSP0294-20121207/23519_1 /ASSEMBLY_ACC=CAM_ASM_000327 /TAXON_ID=39354 /ORGANISM="Heterosigma akashiwo, Strain CCMP2393" /LENGTH=171 /DNA_ID=CAMNT_0053852637 /DNA_START=728 /DNA_END=1243 /DNA_ORIENTATION=-
MYNQRAVVIALFLSLSPPPVYNPPTRRDQPVDRSMYAYSQGGRRVRYSHYYDPRYGYPPGGGGGGGGSGSSARSTSPSGSERPGSEVSGMSCQMTSPREFGYQPPPSFIPRIRLDALRSPRPDEEVFECPDLNMSIELLSSPRSAFTPRSNTSNSSTSTSRPEFYPPKYYR